MFAPPVYCEVISESRHIIEVCIFDEISEHTHKIKIPRNVISKDSPVPYSTKQGMILLKEEFLDDLEFPW